MRLSTRRLALIAAALASTTLAACGSPTAPSATSRVSAPERLNGEGGYQGSVGYRPTDGK